MVIDLYPWLLVSVFIFIAFALKAITGFGENLLMVPLVTLLLPLKTVLPLTLVVVLVVDIYLLYKLYPEINWSESRRLVIPAFIGVGLGSFGLIQIDEKLLEQGVGILVTGYALYQLIGFTGYKKKIASQNLGYVAGLTGGTLSGLSGIGGPPVITYLSSRQVIKSAFRATCVFTFLVFDLLRVGSYTYQELFTIQIGITGLTLLPAFYAGTKLGLLLYPKLPEHLFRQGVSILLLVIGLVLV